MLANCHTKVWQPVAALLLYVLLLYVAATSLTISSLTISAVAYAFLQTERLRRGSAAPLTFPAMRAIVQEVFTGLLFAARPVYVKWINQAQRNFPLRM